ncbi:MAG: Gfo/Idh/MocA family oxidoreductase [Bifidobacteriaceae bacterium]|jgi:predicted dehydrogenase|nr:Gfo/Idh/MocA family oxidoreductase [Bifidobacteriaceae bacterium]
MTEKLRIAVVGAGGWGANHARVFANRPDCDLVGIAARSIETAQRRTQVYGGKPYDDIVQMIEDSQPDLVSVCLPNEEHFEPTLELIRFDVPLLVEKPLVFDVAQGRQLIAEAAARDLFFAINFNHRYAEPVQRAKAAIDQGKLGELVFGLWRFGGEANFGTEPHAGLIETQCHGLDMLEYLVGPIASVAAQMTDRTYPGTFTTLSVALEFAAGGVGALVGSYDSSYSYPDAQFIEVNGTRGRVLIEDTVRRLTLNVAGDETASVWQAGYFNDEARTFTYTFDRHVDAVLAALQAGAPPPIHARAGLRALELAAAIIQSFEAGARVCVAAQ